MIRLVFGIHNHQPVGNFDNVFESAYGSCYLPFLQAISNHPAIKFCFHTTGPLFYWIEEHHHEWFELLKKMIKSGQVEMMGGGFYEPILSVIPEEDQIGQILKMTHYIEHHFGVTPKGMWTAERIWEPGLPTTMAQAGIQYTVLDDTHFKWAGLKDDDLNGYFITENNGDPVYVFPISKVMRYNIPFKQPSETIKYLKQLNDEKGDVLVVYADDGEKFGVWPSTYDTCYNQRWLEKFFHELTQNLGWIKPVFFSEVIDELPPAGRIYLPTASYAEMGQWSLPANGFVEYDEIEKKLKEDKWWDEYGYLVRGGFWRNFLSKYSESNNMHKKMLQLTSLIKKGAEEQIGEDKLSQAIDLKWQAQCNCPYWHGVFGGLYLNHLRYATYSRFIEAEKVLDSKKDDNFLEYDVMDFDKDGQLEIILRNKHLNLYVAPYYGGSLFELDYKPASINLLDTMTRRKEGYHSKLSQAKVADDNAAGSIHDRIEAKEEGLDKYLVYDWHKRVGFLDHFFEFGTTLEQFSRNEYSEKGDFVNRPFEATLNEDKDRLIASLKREGHVWVGSTWALVYIQKNYILKANESGFDIQYLIDNRSNIHLKQLMGIETAWALLAGNAQDRYYHIDGKKLEPSIMASAGVINSNRIGLRDDAFGYDINIKIDRTLDWWRFPIETISLSEGGFERNYQQSTVVPIVSIDLAPGQSFEFNISVEIKNLAGK